MSHKMTISSVAFLSDCVLEEGASVYVEDSGKVFHCIQGFGGQLTWEMKAVNRYDFPEASLQLQEIAFESSHSPVRSEAREGAKIKLHLKKTAPKYLH